MYVCMYVVWETPGWLFHDDNLNIGSEGKRQKVFLAFVNGNG